MRMCSVFALCVIFVGGQTYGNDSMMFNVLLKHTTFAGNGEHGVIFGWALHPDVCPPKQEYKTKLVVEYTLKGKTESKTFQHGLNGMENAYGYFITTKSGETNKGFLHSFFAKNSPLRHGLFQCDISDIPVDAQITKATLILHLDCKDGFANADNSGEFTFFKMNRVWNKDYVDWANYDNGKKWSQSGGDYGAAIKKFHVQKDVKSLGYHKSNKPDVPFDFTDFVKLLQANRKSVSNGVTRVAAFQSTPIITSHVITVRSAGAHTVEILGMNGVSRHSLQGTGPHVWRLPDGLAPSMYLVRIKTQSGVSMHPLIKLKQ